MWFSLYMLLIQFVDMHLLFLFSFFDFFCLFLFNQPSWTQCDGRSVWSRGRKKNMRYFCYSVHWKNIWRPFEWDLYQHKKQTKKQTSRNNNQNQTAAHNRVATAGIFQTLVGGGGICMYDTCMRLMGATRTIRSISSSLLSPLSSLLPSPAFLFLLPPRRDGRLSATPVIHTTARRVSTSHWSELTAAAMRGKKPTTRLIFFFFLLSSPQKHKKDGLNSLFTLPVKYYWSFM